MSAGADVTLTATTNPNIGTEVDQVSLKISYEIIEHFSRNLYSSPNKAIEELVTNGFDAAATRVDIFLPGEHTSDCVVVWDNGNSMDVIGIKDLWRLSDSPKRHMEKRVVTTKSGGERKIIGKFGIGKLASYIVGEKISHLCKSDGRYFLVEIDYRDITEELKGDESYSAPILELSEEDALAFVESAFTEESELLLDLFVEESWTIAVVSELKRDDLYAGRLSWVLSHSMPLRPDFQIYVNSSPVQPKLAKKGVLKTWDFGEEDVVGAIRNAWAKSLLTGDPEEELEMGREVGLDPASPKDEIPFVRLPKLGKVWGTCRLYSDSLERLRKKEEGEPRSHGYFVMVRGRLVNSDDEKLFLGDPNFGIW